MSDEQKDSGDLRDKLKRSRKQLLDDLISGKLDETGALADDDDSVIGFGQHEKCGGPCCGGDGPVRPPRRT